MIKEGDFRVYMSSTGEGKAIIPLVPRWGVDYWGVAAGSAAKTNLARLFSY